VQSPAGQSGLWIMVFLGALAVTAVAARKVVRR
jgi:hypothetical protein